MRFTRSACLVLALSAGCSGSSGTEATVTAEADKPNAGLLADSWMLKTATEEGLAPFQTPGWMALITNRDVPKAAKALGANGGMPGARAHADAAAMFRQAAMCSAEALRETYGETPQEGDPAGTAHLLTVANLILGDAEGAKAAAEKMASVEGDPSASWHAAWAAGTWPPDFAAIPVSLGEPKAGDWPHLGNLPHYELPEQTEQKRMVAMGDPGALVAAAMWHDQVASTLAGDQAAIVEVYDARYLLPIETDPAAAGPMPLDLIFGSELMHPEDGNFLLAVRKDGLSAVDSWKGKSLLADITSRTIVDGKIDPERARDVGQGLRRVVLDEMEAAGGSPMDYHRTFADIARVSALRGLAEVARASGDEYTEGILRISALDHSASAATADPAWLLSMCAYDAGNRFPTRAYELLHNLITRVPELETARYGLDVLSLRVSRESGGGQIPGM
ncbi:MAG: hypothetical protein EP330_02195 [Deltaproteobacteria bacterium]|nr:MAG: hypothetical protein EP330_02195 [Deltaproteobacteria bacterium]